jgi:hypothetical protein
MGFQRRGLTRLPNVVLVLATVLRPCGHAGQASALAPSFRSSTELALPGGIRAGRLDRAVPWFAIHGLAAESTPRHACGVPDGCCRCCIAGGRGCRDLGAARLRGGQRNEFSSDASEEAERYRDVDAVRADAGEAGGADSVQRSVAGPAAAALTEWEAQGNRHEAGGGAAAWGPSGQLGAGELPPKTAAGIEWRRATGSHPWKSAAAVELGVGNSSASGARPPRLGARTGTLRTLKRGFGFIRRCAPPRAPRTPPLTGRLGSGVTG